MTEQFRNLMLIKVCPERSELLACMPDEIQRLTEIAAKMDLQEILSKLNILQDCNEKIGRSLNKRVEIEMCLIKLCARQISQKTLDNTQIYDKIKQSDNSSNKPNEISAANADRELQSNAAPVNSEASPKLSDFKQLAEWSDVLEEFMRICPSVSGTLTGSMAYVYKNIMLIDAKNKFFLKLFKVKDNALQLDKAIQTVMGKPYIIKARCSAAQNEQKKADELVEKAINSGIETAVE